MLNVSGATIINTGTFNANAGSTLENPSGNIASINNTSTGTFNESGTADIAGTAITNSGIFKLMR